MAPVYGGEAHRHIYVFFFFILTALFFFSSFCCPISFVLFLLSLQLAQDISMAQSVVSCSLHSIIVGSAPAQEQYAKAERHNRYATNG
ncbi:hypothetical protein GHT06_013128 [Daphnia sinensis]|uniref:Uncharacterized protein n=1 Tax=Daphnia sinensis TaxID=1820382 RepID=A0AAD5LH37_9CRUS|nr:hypothetical protein GHT06_013128 [Daphnia sinensis]